MYRILDLFSGAGGFSNGLDSLEEFKTLIAVDNNSDALKTFSFNFPEAEVICDDITKADVKKKIVKLSISKKINMIIGGPPCQGFSLKGKKMGLNDPRNFLFLEYFEIVNSIKPEIFIIENVKNLINSTNGYFIKEIESRFTKIGYYVKYDILNSSNFGVPQDRQRAIIIGSKIKPIELPKNLGIKKVTIREAISDLAYLESGEGTVESDYTNKPQSKYQVSMRLNSTQLNNHVATKHSELAIKKLSLIPPECDKSFLPKELWGKQKFKTTWSRLEWNKQSPTIDTRFDTPSNGKNSHPELNRSITAREAARIQSFNDNFIFKGNKTEICKQIGNAVPPLLAKSIGESILSQMSSEHYENENVKLILGNSLNIMDVLLKENIKVNHIITDPPYNISKENNFSTMKTPRTGVDFGKWDKSFDTIKWIEKACKLLDKNGSIIIFCSYIYLSHILDKLENCNIEIKDILKWEKSNPMPRNVERRYVSDTEYAIWGVNQNAKWVFNKPKNISYLRSTFKHAVVSGKEKNGHPTQKSLKLMNDIIKIHTNENETILDPFMGSGSTGIAALMNDRKFLGIEMEKKYFDITKGRIDNFQKK